VTDATQHSHQIGSACVAHVHLGAVEHVVVAVGWGSHLHPSRRPPVVGLDPCRGEGPAEFSDTAHRLAQHVLFFGEVEVQPRSGVFTRGRGIKGSSVSGGGATGCRRGRSQTGFTRPRPRRVMLFL